MWFDRGARGNGRQLCWRLQHTVVPLAIERRLSTMKRTAGRTERMSKYPMDTMFAAGKIDDGESSTTLRTEEIVERNIRHESRNLFNSVSARNPLHQIVHVATPEPLTEGQLSFGVGTRGCLTKF